MKIRHIYLLIAVLGTIVPYYYFGKFLLNFGFDLNEFWRQLTENPISLFFTSDVVLSTFAVITLVLTEGKSKGMKNLWIYIVFNLIVGVSLALPAFLYSRQRIIDKNKVSL
ncbi:MAG: DUF2834 domain-containing protein [Flavobacteriaceae bacterium]|jgi:lysylphosphatidylglycerol synthetase-like protein (DUF2156 family)|nr:DUF2834 domain-containing protein [Flavobacteriaceae bacterium]